MESAIDGVDALNKIRLNPPDLILTDYEMPRMTGVELSSSVRGSKPTEDIPIIMITSRSTSKHRLEADNAGVSSYITKPWSEPQLLSSVEELLMSRQTAQSFHNGIEPEAKVQKDVETAG